MFQNSPTVMNPRAANALPKSELGPYNFEVAVVNAVLRDMQQHLTVGDWTLRDKTNALQRCGNANELQRAAANQLGEAYHAKRAQMSHLRAEYLKRV